MAADALTRCAIEEPPIPLEAIAASLAIPVRPVNLPQFFTAATVYEDGLPVMIVNWAKPEIERRAALAHMLGHLLLLLDDSGNAFPRDQRGHEEADLVAEELLMPTGMVIDQSRLWFNDYRYLARLFAIEEQQMLAKLQDLGIVRGPQGIAWDY